MLLKKKVLIFPAGTEIALEIFNALKYSKFIELYGGTSSGDHSEFVYKNLITGFPYVYENSFIEYLNFVIEKYDIDCVYPAHDSVSVVLSDNKDKVKAQVIITDRETTDICRSKKKTYELFAGCKFIPKLFKDPNDVKTFPVFVKPEIGQGSIGAQVCNNVEELYAAVERDKTLVICENLPGEEITVDCFTDNYGNLLVIKPRVRERIRMGISVRGHLIECEPEISDIANLINRKMSFFGAWFFQLKKNKDDIWKLLEISPRVPGTMGLSRNLGINYPLLTLFLFWGYDVSIIDNGYGALVDRALYSCYKLDIDYKYVYLDFDDTLIVNSQVNEDLMRFIYQSLNKDKKIILLSKHRTDIYEDLDRFKISKDIFDKIIVISDGEEKSKYIAEKNSIFIDDSFAERKNVHDKLHIPVFDLDMIESLIDWKK